MKLSRLDLAELDFGKQGGLLPVIAQNAATMEVLTLAFMDREALKKTIETGYMHYYSRTRKKLWKKGEQSGNMQKALEVFPDCDSDSLLFYVEQKNDVACHDGTRNCFKTDRFNLERLFQIIKERRDGPKKLSSMPGMRELSLASRTIQSATTVAELSASRTIQSYTAQLLKDKKLRGSKVLEEAEEVVRAAEKEGMDRVVYESGDLFYHLLVLMAGEGVELEEVLQELARRRK